MALDYTNTYVLMTNDFFFLKILLTKTEYIQNIKMFFLETIILYVQNKFYGH